MHDWFKLHLQAQVQLCVKKKHWQNYSTGDGQGPAKREKKVTCQKTQCFTGEERMSAYRCWEEDTDCCCCFSVVVPMLIVKWWTTDWSLRTILSTTCPASISSRTRVAEANEGARGSQIVALASFAFLPFFSNKISPSKTFAISLGLADPSRSILS